MKVLHVSDTHGKMWMPRHDEADVVVHSGDFFPSFSRGVRDIEVGRQRAWLANERHRLRRIIGDRPFIFCAGNHDYYSPERMLRDGGIDCRDITHSHTNVIVGSERIRFDGFPYVNWMYGEWNYEVREEAMHHVIDHLSHSIDDTTVLVSHGPSYGVFDQVRGIRVGSKALAAFVIEREPMAHLHGHVHEDNGMRLIGRTLVSNAATTSHIIELIQPTRDGPAS